MVALSILTTLLLVNLAATFAALWAGTTWGGGQRRSVARTMSALGAMLFIGAAFFILANVLQRALSSSSVPVTLLTMVGLLGAQWWLQAWGIERILEISWQRSVACLSLAVGMNFGLILVFAFVLAPFVVQAYVSPSNSMAPTILGIHRRGVCSHCGGVAIVPANPSLDLSEEPPQIGICTVCRKTGDVPEVAPEAYGPDRFIVDKLAKPQRWDIVAFRSPEDVQTIYLFRLVGLPGEKLYIKEGKVWINDVAQTLPLEMEGLEYGMGEDEDIELDFGSPDRPLQLGESEYGMLGDFSRRAFDGRFWGPVPEDQLIGVVTLRYWPPSRWTVWQ